MLYKCKGTLFYSSSAAGAWRYSSWIWNGCNRSNTFYPLFYVYAYKEKNFVFELELAYSVSLLIIILLCKNMCV